MGAAAFPGGARGNQQAGVALMEGQDGLAVDPEQHQIGLPMARGTAIRNRRRPLRQRAAQSDKGRRATPLVATAPAFGFGPGQIVAPGVLCFAGHLRIDEAVDGLVGDDRSVLAPERGGRPPVGGTSRVGAAPGPWRGACCRGRAWSPASAAPGLVGRHSLVGSPGCVDALRVQFPSHGRWRAIQSCRNLAERVSRGV